MRTGYRSLTKPKEYYWQTFCIALLTAACFFVPFIVMDKGYFLFYGDFNVQQVPFYKLAHEAVRSGNWFWDFGTDLGANFIGSYSFYLLGSPFFWLTIPFPTDFVPHLMGPLLILKFACAALTAYCFLTRFMKNKQFALLGGLLYAFSGFSVYNIFFNHFHEAIVFFPLLLLALEQLMVDNRRGFFLFMVTICAVSNYFFFAGMVVFLFLYYVLRVLSGDWKVTTAKFFQVALESLLGVGLGAVILLPSFLVVMQNSRVSSFPLGWGGILYGRNQIPAYIFQSFFFPPELPARPSFFTSADVKWSSVAGWLPVFSMVGVIGWLQVKKGTWLRRIICILAFMAFVPILNSAFYAFNYAYYARWFYMPILMMVLATCKGLEDTQVNWSSAFKWTAGITLGIILVVGFFPTNLKGDLDFKKDFGLYDKNLSELFWITCAIAVAGLIVMYVLLHLRKKSTHLFLRTAVASVCVVSVLYASYFIGSGKSYSYNTKNYIIPSLLESDITLEGKPVDEIDDSRMDVYKGMDNVAMFLGMSGIQAFHSIVPNAIFDYYDYIGVERVVGSRPDTENYAIRSFLSVKYMFDAVQDNGNDDNRFGLEDEYGNYTVIPGWTEEPISTQDGFDIYENEYFIPYGFTYDYFMTRDYSDKFSNNERQHLMLQAILLDEEQIERHSDILADINSLASQDWVFDRNGNLVQNDGTYYPDLSESSYKQHCLDRAAHSADSFVTDSRGFTSEIDLERENLVFYSIPYDEGWSATVDGEPVQIEKVNVGFMAVRVPEGEHTIRFDYDTPGLSMGIWITFGSAGIALLYLLITFLYYRYKRQDALIDIELQRAARLTGGHTAFQSQPPVYGPDAPSVGPAPGSVDAAPFHHSEQSAAASPVAPETSAAPPAAAQEDEYLSHPIRPANYSMDEFTPTEPSGERCEPPRGDNDLYSGGITPPKIRDSRTQPSTGFAAFRPTPPPVPTTPSEPAADKGGETPPPAPDAPEEDARGVPNVIDGFDPEQYGRFLRSIQDQKESDSASQSKAEDPHSPPSDESKQ